MSADNKNLVSTPSCSKCGNALIPGIGLCPKCVEEADNTSKRGRQKGVLSRVHLLIILFAGIIAITVSGANAITENSLDIVRDTIALASAIITFSVFGTTIYLALQNRDLMQKPAVQIYLRKSPLGPGCIVNVGDVDLVVANEGNGPAYDLKFTIKNEQLPKQNENITTGGFLTSGLSYLPSKRKCAMHFTTTGYATSLPDDKFIIEFDYRDKARNRTVEQAILQLATILEE